MLTTKEIIDLCDYAGIEWRDYSGRGMYGSRCLGIVTDSPTDTVLELVNAANERGAPSTRVALDADTEIDNLRSDRDFVSGVLDTLECAKTDSMGRSTIVYWEHLEVSDSD